MRFLFAWQHVEPSARLTGIDGLRAVVESLDGFELAADAWERAVLPDRIDGYQPSLLDTLCLTGEVGWARLSPSGDSAQLVGATPVALFLREHAESWQALRDDETPGGNRQSAADGSRAGTSGSPAVTGASAAVLDALCRRGASFIPDVMAACSLDEAAVRRALADLVAGGLVASDGFGGLRTIVRGSGGRPAAHATRHNVTGRWSVLRAARHSAAAQPERSAGEPMRGAERQDPAIVSREREAAVELQARTLLRRYGIVFRRLLTREANAAPWRELTRVYRRLEARGEIRGGRFVSGMSGEQFARGDAIERLREIRRRAPDGRCLVISAADPLNLAGIVTPGDRVRAVTASRVAYRNGVPLAAMEGDYVRPLTALTDVAPALAAEVATSLAGRPMPPVVSGFLGRS